MNQNNPNTQLPEEILKQIDTEANEYVGRPGESGTNELVSGQMDCTLADYKEEVELLRKQKDELVAENDRIKKMLEAQDANVEILIDKERQLQQENKRLKASYESFFKQCWLRLIDREVTDEREINNAWLVHKLRNGIEEESNTPLTQERADFIREVNGRDLPAQKELTPDELRVLNKTTAKQFKKEKDVITPDLQAKGNALSLALRRLIRSITVHPDYSNNGEWGDYISEAEKVLAALESNTPAEVQKDEGVLFAEWLYRNRWFHFENGKWHYTFEMGTSMSDKTYQKNYVKPTSELYAMFQKETKTPNGCKLGKEGI